SRSLTGTIATVFHGDRTSFSRCWRSRSPPQTDPVRCGRPRVMLSPSPGRLASGLTSSASAAYYSEPALCQRGSAMSLATAFTDLVGCTIPIQQAGMGGVSTPDLAAAVSNAGGLGMLTASADNALADVSTALTATAGRPVGINFLMPFFDR